MSAGTVQRNVKRERATVHDVAREANLSITTVSRVLNDHSYVSDGNRERVLSAVKKLKYTVNWAGRSLKKGSMKLIAYLTYEIYPNPFFSCIGSVLEEEARKSGFSLVISETRQSADVEMSLAKLCVERCVDGVVWAKLCNPKALDVLAKRDIPVVIIERPDNLKGTTRILTDNVVGSREATQHLIELGHRRIAYVGANPEEYVEKERLQGYYDQMRDSGVGVREDMIELSTYQPSDAYKSTRKLLANDAKPTAIFCGGSINVSGVIHALMEAGIRIPQDMSLICYDDAAASYFYPYLTYVRTPLEEMARVGFEQLRQLIAKTARGGMVVKFETHLVVRGSTAPPASISGG